MPLLWRKSFYERLSRAQGCNGQIAFLGKIEARTFQPIQDKDRGESPEGETNREGRCGDAAMYNIIYKCGGSEQGELVKTEVLRVKCLQEDAVLPKRCSEGAVGYDLSTSCNCVIHSRGKGLVQTGLAINLPSGVYARIAPRSGLALKKFIDVGVGVL